MPTPKSNSPAVEALGLGDQLSEQVAGETEETRKKRMLEQQQIVQIGNSLAATSLFGTRAGAGY